MFLHSTIEVNDPSSEFRIDARGLLQVDCSDQDAQLPVRICSSDHDEGGGPNGRVSGPMATVTGVPSGSIATISVCRLP